MINNFLIRASKFDKFKINSIQNSIYKIISQNMAYHKGPGKSIYNKKKFTNPEFNENNTIDITDSNMNNNLNTHSSKIHKEMDLNLNLEIKTMEKDNLTNSRKDTPVNELKVKTQTYQDHMELEKEIQGIKDFDYDIFKKRNKEILSKDKKKKKIEKIEKQENEESDLDLDEDQEIDEKTLAKLQELINQDQEGKDNFKPLNKAKEENVKIDEEGEPLPEEKPILVNRPLKNFVWGLGQQTKQRKFKFTQGEYPTVEALVNFLEVNNLKDIIVVPVHKLGLIHLKENNIICSGHTSRHIYKSAKDLVVEIKKLNIPNLPHIPTVYGRRDEEWVIVEIGEVTIHFFQEQFRKEIDLLDRWVNPPPEEFVEWQRRVEEQFYGRKK
jgi:ribosome-associated protein